MLIGFASQDPRSHYWVILGHAAQERAQELGVEIDIQPADTLQDQLAVIQTFIAQRVDALIVGPFASRGLGEALKQAQAVGIPVISSTSDILDCAVTCTVRSNNVEGGRLIASYLVERLGGSGKVVHLIGPEAYQDAIDRAKGVHSVLDTHSGIQVVFEQVSPDWNIESGAALMKTALAQHPDIQAICASNDYIALGALSQLRAEQLGQVVVTGFDAVPDALLAIRSGEMSATVRQSIRGIGRTIVEMAVRAARGEHVPTLVSPEISVVTDINVVDAALEAVTILPGVLAATVERGEALAKARDEIIYAQAATLRELSTPLIPITDTVMVMPLLGAIDSARAQQMVEHLLAGISANQTQVVILDITGVPIIDTHVANALLQAAQAVRLLGAQMVLTGIRPEVAQSLVGLGVVLNGIVTRSTLQSGITYAFQQR